MNKIQIVSAVVTGGAAQDFELGADFSRIKILNATDRTELEYVAADTVNTFGMTIAAAGTKAKAANAAAGVVALETDEETSKGIQIGASATVLDTTGDVLIIEASFGDE